MHTLPLLLVVLRSVFPVVYSHERNDIVKSSGIETHAKSSFAPHEPENGTYPPNTNVTRNEFKEYGVPQDTGGNYGDLLHLRRQNGDELLTRETIVNEHVDSDYQELHYYAYFRAKITAVRVLNFGRQRAYTTEVASDGSEGHVDAYMVIAPRYSIRTFVEVYGIL